MVGGCRSLAARRSAFEVAELFLFEFRTTSIGLFAVGSGSSRMDLEPSGHRDVQEDSKNICHKLAPGPSQRHGVLSARPITPPRRESCFTAEALNARAVELAGQTLGAPTAMTSAQRATQRSSLCPNPGIRGSLRSPYRFLSEEFVHALSRKRDHT